MVRLQNDRQIDNICHVNNEKKEEKNNIITNIVSLFKIKGSLFPIRVFFFAFAEMCVGIFQFCLEDDE